MENLFFVGLMLIVLLLAVLCVLGAKHKNPVIRDKPKPDARLYSIDRADKKAVKKWLK